MTLKEMIAERRGLLERYNVLRDAIDMLMAERDKAVVARDRLDRRIAGCLPHGTSYVDGDEVYTRRGQLIEFTALRRD